MQKVTIGKIIISTLYAALTAVLVLYAIRLKGGDTFPFTFMLIAFAVFTLFTAAQAILYHSGRFPDTGSTAMLLLTLAKAILTTGVECLLDRINIFYVGFNNPPQFALLLSFLILTVAACAAEDIVAVRIKKA